MVILVSVDQKMQNNKNNNNESFKGIFILIMGAYTVIYKNQGCSIL